MEPQLPSPSQGAERSPSHLERVPGSTVSPEIRPGPLSGERQESHEHQPGVSSDPSPQVQPAVPPLPQLRHDEPHGTASQPVDETPLVAADDDLIEREWVDKAKKVIAETRRDPYLQERAVSKLQADYLQKRYNKTVKVPGESA